MNQTSKKDEKFNFRVTSQVPKATKDRLRQHHMRMIAAYEGEGSVVFSDALRDIIEKGLDVAEKEVQS